MSIARVKGQGHRSRSGSTRSVCSRSSIKYSLFSTGYCIIDGRGRVYVVSRVTNAVTISRVSNNVHARNDLTVLCLALSVGIGKEVCRYNWRSAGSLGWPFPMLQYKYIFQKNTRKQFYQTTLGNCYGFKLPKYRLQLKNKIIMSFIIIFCKRSLPIFLYISQFTKKRCLRC